jgi:glycosyltransferase involved in cell wall biosynthesis
MPKISVIVPVYKVEKYIHRCVDSILDQTYTDFELILVDDGSPDQCGGICDEYAQKDSRVVVIHQKNGGLSAARNTGIDWMFDNSESEWLTFIDSDDWIHPRMLETLLDAAVTHNTDICVCDYSRTSGQPQVYAQIRSEACKVTVSQAYNIRGGLLDLAVAKLIRRQLVSQVRFPVGLLFEDAWTMYKIIFTVTKLTLIPEPLYFYYFNAEGITGSAWKPAWLTEIDAHETQIRFMQERGLTDTLQVCTELFFSVIHKQYHIVKTMGHMYNSYLRKLRCRAVVALILYGKYLPVGRTVAILETYYPLFSRGVGICRSVREG